jgi:hypothetical protein
VCRHNKRKENNTKTTTLQNGITIQQEGRTSYGANSKHSTDLLEKLIVPQTVKKFHAFYEI